VVTKVEELVAAAEQAKPLLVLADLEPSPTPVLGALRALRQHSLTQHLPIIALAGERLDKLKAEAEAAGVTLLVGDTAILNHLPQLLDQALQIE
jgi:CheY-like chemotaxis protein